MNQPSNVDQRATAGRSVPYFGPHDREVSLVPKIHVEGVVNLAASECGAAQGGGEHCGLDRDHVGEHWGRPRSAPPRREVDAIQAIRDELAADRADRAALEARVKALEEANDLDLSRREP